MTQKEEIILVIFALFYYLFCIFLILTYVEDIAYEKKWYVRILWLLVFIIIAPIAVPMMLGIEIGKSIKE